jgi:hypothetical protein
MSRTRGGNKYQDCIDKCNKKFRNALDIAEDTGASNSVVSAIHKKRQNCHKDCKTSVADIDGGKKKRKSLKKKRKSKRRKSMKKKQRKTKRKGRR